VIGASAEVKVQAEVDRKSGVNCRLNGYHAMRGSSYFGCPSLAFPLTASSYALRSIGPILIAASNALEAS
jgi:hypothetical protein